MIHFISIQLFSQNFEAEMKAIFDKMDTVDNISIVVDVKLYDKKGGKLIYNNESSVLHSKKATITKLGDMEMYKSASYDIQIDHEEKRLLIKKIASKQESFSDVNVKEIKKLLKLEGVEKSKNPTYKLISNNNGVKTYSMSKTAELVECFITIDTKNEKIQNISYLYTEQGDYDGQYCTLDYKTFTYNSVFSKTQFDLSRYFTLVGGNYKLSTRLSSYKLYTE